MPPLHPPALASGSPSPYLCQYNLCSVQSASLHNKPPSAHPGSLCLEGRGWGRGCCLQGSWGPFFPESVPRGPSTPAREPAFVIFLNGKMEDCTLSPGAWPPGLWPPRERAHEGEERGWPPSLLLGPWGALLAPGSHRNSTGGPWGCGPVLASAQAHGEGPSGMPSLGCPA